MAGYRTAERCGSEKPMRTVRFFNLYISNFGALVLANLLMLPFDLLAFGYAALTYKLLGGINIAVASACLIILNVGMAGTSLVCRYICTEKEFSTFKAFIKGIKENAPRFFLHGVLFYMVFAISYLSITLYYAGTKESGVFWLLLVIASLIAVAFLFSSYYMNVMTVTMDIPLRSIYRNCALFSFGELKNNIFATFGLIILAVLLYTIVFIINDFGASMVVLVSLMIFILPSTVQYIITFYVYDDMVAMLDKDRKMQKQDEESGKEDEKPMLDKSEAEDISRLTSESRDEYIFHNGRMIKRYEVMRMLSTDDSDDE